MQRIRTRRRLALACGALVAALAAGTAVAASGQSGRAATPTHALRLVTTKLSCGDTVTANSTLGNDLDCPHDALTVTGSNVVLNLNGHTITGSGLDTGVYVSGSTVTIENGRVMGFHSGVSLNGTGDRALNLHVVGNSFGIDAFADSVVVAGSFVSGSSSIGIRGGTGVHIQITNNWVRGNTRGILVDGPGTLISGNKVLSNNQSGIDAADSVDGTGIVITGNTANSNGVSGIVSANGATLTRNTASANTGLGIDANPEDTDGGGNRATGNGALHQCENVVCS